MNIDHIFIFVNSKKEADELVNFGLSEGSGNIHKGIGTANRRFFFENFYLEILWVHNEAEAKSVEEIGIFERFDYKNSGYSRYGLCLANTDDTNIIFNESIKWKAQFLQDSEHVDIFTSNTLPWIFRFPKKRNKNVLDESKTHRLGLKKLSKVTFQLKEDVLDSRLIQINKSSIVKFQKANKNYLVLEFDNSKQNKTKSFANLGLVINY